VIDRPQQSGHTWIWRKLVAPVVRALHRGGSPRRIAWSLAAGVVIGVNPLVGSATILTITVTHLLRLKHSASQLGVHTAYPLQLMLFLPFMQAGAILFQTDPLPFEKKELLSLMHEQPLQLFRSLWMWEWHALIVWLAVAAILTPSLAILFRRMLEHTRRQPYAIAAQ